MCIQHFLLYISYTKGQHLLLFTDLDPCIDVVCDYHAICKAFGPFDARCVCIDSCPSYQEPICSSNGTTYDNKCLFKQEMCLLQLNFTVQHPGSCEGISDLVTYGINCYLIQSPKLTTPKKRNVKKSSLTTYRYHIF